MQKRLIRRAVNLVTAVIPVRKWRHAVRDLMAWRLELLLDGRRWDELKTKAFAESGKTALVVAHDLSVTGAPMAMLMEVQALLKNGFSVMAAAGGGGGLEPELEKLGAPVVLSPAALRHHPSIKRLAGGFDLVVVNSLVCGEWARALAGDAPMMWYIHESRVVADYLQARPELKQALIACPHLYAVSEHAASFLPDGAEAKILHLGVPDKAGAVKTHEPGDKVRFAVVGSYLRNKGQHLMLEALAGLDEERLKELEFHFIGGNRQERYYQSLLDQCRPHWPVVFGGEINDQAEKWEIYNVVDVFCVPSRDESCSLVLLEACMLGKPFIISDKVGGRYMLEEKINGLSFAAGDADELRRAILWCLDHKSRLAPMGLEARKAYEAMGSGARFERRFMDAVGLVMGRDGREPKIGG